MMNILIDSENIIFVLSSSKLRIYAGEKGRLLHSQQIDPSFELRKESTPTMKVQASNQVFHVIVQVAGMQDTLEAIEFIKYAGYYGADEGFKIWNDGKAPAS